jgi:hypothetical protein
LRENEFILLTISRSNVQMKIFALACLTLTLSPHPVISHSDHYDVCVVGAGAGGISTAIHAKDRNLSVVVIERQPRAGGNCDTIYFPSTPPDPNFTEIGVAAFADTIKANIDLDGSPQGRWGNFDLKGFFSRFVGDEGILYNDFSGGFPNFYKFDDKDNTFAPEVSPPDPDFVGALGRLTAIHANYTWIEFGIPQGPVPDDLLKPFDQFISEHQLQPLLPIISGNVYSGGLGTWSKLPAIWALRALTPTEIRTYFTPRSHFSINHGCQDFYNKVVDFLGSSNVLLGSTITEIKRKPNDVQIKISGREDSNNGTTILKCQKLIMSFPQVLEDMTFLDLDDQERELFSTVNIRYYFNGAVEFTGPIAENSTYIISHQNTSNAPYNLANSPAWANVARLFPNTPSPFYAFSDDPIPTNEMRAEMDRQFNVMASAPSSLITGHTIGQFYRHKYQPYPSNNALQSTTNFFQKVDALQGHLNTYWTGALLAGNSHMNIFLHSYNLVNSDRFEPTTASALRVMDHKSPSSVISSENATWIGPIMGMIATLGIIIGFVYFKQRTLKKEGNNNKHEVAILPHSHVPC